MTRTHAPVRDRANGTWIDRRTFLKLAGAGACTLFAAEAGARGAFARAATEAAAPDPLDRLALELEFDPERIFRYVADEIAYEPYSGVLRGPEGTLAGRSGNSADQSVLLAALLERSGIGYRFALGPLDDVTANVLLSGTAMDLATARAEFEATIRGAVPDGGAAAAASDPSVSVAMEAAVARADDVVAWARDELTRTADVLGAALSGSGIVVPNAFSGIPDVERDEHVWVQMASGPAWIDMDPSTPASLPGDTSTTESTSIDALPPELRHVLRFEVVAEVVEGGRLREETLLDVEEDADVLSGQPIGFANIEREGFKAIGADIVSALEGGTTYLPCLLLGDGVIVGPGAIRFGGDPTEDPFAAIAGSPGPLPDGEPIAQWFQVTILSPGSEPVVVRRAIFDRLGPAAREAAPPDLSAITPATLVPIEPDATPDYLPAQRSLWMTVATGRDGGERLQGALTGTVADVNLPAVAAAHHLLGEAGGVELGLPVGVGTFIDRPNIVAVTVDQELAEDGTLKVRPVIDILHRSHATRPVTGIPPALAPSIVAGVIPHVVERILVGDAIRGTANPARSTSVGSVFDEARRQGIGVRTITAGDDIASLPYPADAQARLRAALSDGTLVAVAPEQAVPIGSTERLGWWLVDPQTGAVSDQMDDGRGVAAEDMTIIIPRVRNAQALRRLRQCQVIIFLAALGVLLGTFAGGTAIGVAAAGGSRRQSLGFAMLGAGALGGGDVFEGAAAGC